MGVVRIIAWVLIGIAVALGGADGISTLEAGTARIRSAAEIFALFGIGLGPVEGGGLAGLANLLLATPLWASLGLLGLVLTLLSRPID